MPNHLHGIIVIIESQPIGSVGAIHESPLPTDMVARRSMLIPKLIGRFKMTSAKAINEMRTTPGVPVWQRNYYEHIIRDENDLMSIRDYILNNPLKWALDEENPDRIYNERRT